MRNILITGGAGFLGTNLIEHIAASKDNIHITVLETFQSPASRQRRAYLEQRYPNLCTFEEADITLPPQIEDIFARVRPELVIHLAALAHGEKDEQRVRDVNSMGTKNLVEIAENNGTKRFYYQSTGLVYGQFDSPTLVADSSPIHPEGIYAQTKAEGEKIISETANHMEYVIGRVCNVYGPWQSDTDLIPRTITSGLSDKQIFLTGDGSQTRQFLFAPDAVTAIWTLANKGENGQTYNIAPREFMPIRETAASTLRALGKPESLLTLDTNTPTGRNSAVMEASRLRHLLPNWPQYDFEEGISRTVDWYRREDRETRAEVNILPHFLQMRK